MQNQGVDENLHDDAHDNGENQFRAKHARIHQVKLDVEHGTQHHESHLGRGGNGPKIGGDKSVGLAAQAKKHRDQHHKQNGDHGTALKELFEIPFAENDAPGFTFVVRSMTIDFLKPAVLDDVLDVVTLPQEVRGASITLLQECRRAEDLLVTARVRVAFISGGKAQRIPKALRLAMEGHK